MMQDVLATFPAIEIKKDESLSHYTNTKTGGPADYVAFPKSISETKALLEYADAQQIPVTVIGNASNLIVKDGGIRGLTLILTKMNQIHASDHQVVAEAGAALIDATKAACHASLTGLEFAAGIPGSVGGAIFMNAGAYGGEISEVVAEVTVLTADGQLKTLSNEALDFGYRHSTVQDYHDTVVSATFKLKSGDQTKIQARMDELNFLRASKQPLEWPSCGSVFKRPTGYFTGKLIHDAGLQGTRVGGAEVSKKHAGFIINVDHATATDYMEMIHHIQTVVFEKFGVHLETEVRIIGEDA
ncbi:UDP-N-acetylmuramate dehydrogenase [Lactiplantibacillus mudanjiangensis]|uniref:UDP-N-acetylenolpyruvoylglucosamine reductase n=1 Tax=Lactiplantibacillus mudanjiangensis TaxID=1296538 RepID=A0A660DYY4_9LACO|nr:UDP-N-acetylmuramate dehydrogenase [Lactiplantibacillus mudanjiangensis]VDG17880.1 UDP-N-acetylmuramate dehydrogenase [Lactobacillus sp.] [Lactiplantibacillus mudanjiangensis]VDG23329.1 UDP-N-acetylmuramate dehydrogenase [Lactobacillus sp.] [Lactiplantibacillus mudanjiangensis]VDG28293.1 UDP-N-acetylmuramate dehydrogenase [Lactobacillus sp.] [Lactiplantibacillus mudanjiangensis]VDG32421.1 UDP-N-acetylmuramate dehydrogenase [Lactobacillus sp.] [Lactiplantibacillus mudanjiangensis]